MRAQRRPLTLLVALALTGGLSACGSDDELSAPLPRTSPDLTIPSETTESRANDAATSTTSTTSTTAAPAATPPPAAAPPAAAAPPPPAAPSASPTTGGQAPATGGQSTTGGAQAGGGEFENFCAQNPGAC